MDHLIQELLGNDFQKIWNTFKARYIFGSKEIPIQKWIASKIISVKEKALTPLEKIKLQLGMRHIDSSGWLKITHVLDGGAAQAAGLAPGDLLASINGQRITSGRLDQVLGGLAQEKNISISFYRDDLEHERILILRAEQLPKQYSLTPKNTKA